jgi:tripartite-type tricarboxylate transporter receptor subunit TctC
MRTSSFLLQIAGTAAMAVALMASPVAHADEASDFYQGKSITLYLGYPPGGAYDLYARVIARHMSRHMAGQPQFVVRHKPGAASLNLVNELYNVLPRDGSVIGMFARSIALNRLLGRDGASYDPVAFNWIGSANNEVSICGVWHGVGVRSTTDFLARPLVFAANAPGAESDVYPNVLNSLIGTRFKVVAGYPGVNDLTLALERGEADARCGWSFGALKAAKPDWIRDKKIYIAVQFAAAKHPELPDVPLVSDLAGSAQARGALELILTQQVMGRPLAAPPQVPPARVAALRQAFARTLSDPEFRAEAERLALEIDPVTGETLQAMVERMFGAPREAVEAARRAIGQR